MADVHHIKTRNFNKSQIKGKDTRIAFLNSLDTVHEGIYPAYLYYKEKELLFLAYGLSETNKPNKSWNITGEKTMAEYFSENNLRSPERYGSSYVFKDYDTRKRLVEQEVNDDLNKLI